MVDYQNEQPFTLGDNVRESDSARPKRRKSKRVFLSYSIISFVALLIIVAVGMIWFDTNKRFPLVPEGVYLGKIEGLFNQVAVGLYAERLAGSEELILVVIRDGWYPQRVRLTSIKGLPFMEDKAMPVLVAGASGRLRFVGKQLNEGSYGGVVMDIAKKISGNWTLNLYPQQEDNLTAEPEVIELAKLRADLEATIRQASLSEALLEGRLAKLVELNKDIADQQGLAVVAEERFDLIRNNLVKQKKILAQKEEQVTELQKQLEVAQRITAMGKLVSLSRESLERESRWVAAVLASAAQYGDIDEETLKKAHTIVELMDEIEQERLELERLENGISGRKSGRIVVPQEPVSFESLWQD